MTSTRRLPRWPTPAELSRTLLAGVVPATLVLPGASRGNDTVVRVIPYVGASAAAIAVLADDLTSAGVRLRSAVTEAPGPDTAALLDVLDVPPLRTDLPRARLCVAGWVESLDHDDQRSAAIDVACGHPAGELLTVGHSATLYRLHPAELSLTRGDTTYDVDVEELRAAEPDPVYSNEHQITEHLQHHHYDELTAWALDRLDGDARRTLRQVTITGIDRYGLDLACVTSSGCVRPRVTFADPVPDEEALGDALRELDRCACWPSTP